MTVADHRPQWLHTVSWLASSCSFYGSSLFSPMFIQLLLTHILSHLFHSEDQLKWSSHSIISSLTSHLINIKGECVGTCASLSQGSRKNRRSPFGTSAGLAGRKNTCVHEEGRKPILSGTTITPQQKKQAAYASTSQTRFIWMRLMAEAPAWMPPLCCCYLNMLRYTGKTMVMSTKIVYLIKLSYRKSYSVIKELNKQHFIT